MGRAPGSEVPRPRGDSVAPPPEEPLPEGREAPPPGVRTMAAVRWGIVALMALAAIGAWVYRLSPSAHLTARMATQYHCPMHPSVLADHPGGCPICGMDLVPLAATPPVAAAAAATEPVRAAAVPVAATGAYWCPMHPEITSDDPSATCPKCGGMKLLPRPRGGEEAASAPAAPGVPGLVPLDLGPDRVQLIGVRTAPAVRERLAPTLRALGTVTPAERGIALVSARFAGWLEDLRVAESGTFVRRGQLLARLASPELEALQVAYLNAVQWGKKDRGGAPPSPGGDALERQTHDRLLRVGIAEADLREIARRGEQLPALGVYAPVSGFVGRKTAVSGLYVQPGTELYEIVDLSTIWVVAEVYEPDIGRVKVGLHAAITLPALPERTFHGRVDFLYPAVTAGSRTLQARIALANPRLELRPGMYADVALELEALDAVVVPLEAVVDTGLEQYVFVARPEGRFEPRRVRLGARAGGKVQLLDGPAEGEQVATTAQFLLDSESRLRAAIGGSGASAPPPHPQDASRTVPLSPATGGGEGRDEGATATPTSATAETMPGTTAHAHAGTP